MKTNKYILLLFFLVFFGSCNDEFLVRPDLDSITTDNFWKTANDLDLYVRNYYTSFPSWGVNEWSGGIYWRDDDSDNLTYFNADTRLLGDNVITSGNGNWDYSSIRAINIFLANYDQVDASMDEISHFVGEAYFFRAYFYFNLLRSYGAVPYVDKPLAPDSEELYSSRTPRNVVAQNILNDLDQAISMLNSGKVSNGNRISKEVAMLFKSRVALYEGTWEKYHANTAFGVSGSDGREFLQIAEQTAEQLMANPGGYALHSTGDPNMDYWHLFNQVDYGSNTEVMLWRDYNRDIGIAHNGQRYLPRNGGGRGLTKELVDSYLCTDGKPIALSDLYQGDRGLTNVAANRDPRLAQTVYLPGDPMSVVNGEIVESFERAPLFEGGENNCPTAYMIFKGANPDPVQFSAGLVGETSSPVFRFAEVYLNFAEAKAEMGTITQDDLDRTINMLRARVNMPPLVMSEIEMDPNWKFPNLSPIINEIRRERQVEFALEGHRFDDLMRWQAADEVIIGKRVKGAYFVQETFPELTIGVDVFVDEEGYIDPLQNEAPNGFNFNPNRDYLLPIPINELTLNPNLEQNPGW